VSTHLERELSEQPEALARLFDRQRDEASRIASLLRRSDVNYILIASRGSSSNVARYAQYLLGRAHRVPVAFATPSLYTLYGQPPRLDGAPSVRSHSCSRPRPATRARSPNSSAFPAS